MSSNLPVYTPQICLPRTSGDVLGASQAAYRGPPQLCACSRHLVPPCHKPLPPSRCLCASSELLIGLCSPDVDDLGRATASLYLSFAEQQLVLLQFIVAAASTLAPQLPRRVRRRARVLLRCIAEAQACSPRTSALRHFCPRLPPRLCAYLLPPHARCGHMLWRVIVALYHRSRVLPSLARILRTFFVRLSAWLAPVRTLERLAVAFGFAACTLAVSIRLLSFVVAAILRPLFVRFGAWLARVRTFARLVVAFGFAACTLAASTGLLCIAVASLPAALTALPPAPGVVLAAVAWPAVRRLYALDRSSVFLPGNIMVHYYIQLYP